MARFMAASVAGSRSGGGQRRRSRAFAGGASPGGGGGYLGTSPGGGGGMGALPKQHHLLPLDVPLSALLPPQQPAAAAVGGSGGSPPGAPPPARQRLAGLWTGRYGPHGIEVLRIAYNFSGASARIVGTKVTGDENIPAGKDSWTAAAGAMPTPWGEAEQLLVDNAALYGGAADEGAPPAGSDEEEGAAAPPPPPRRRIAAIHAGMGQVAIAGYEAASWVEGRLLVYDDGSCGFLYMQGIFFLVNYARLRL